MKVSLTGKNKYLDKLLSDGRFRMFMAAALSGGFNFLYSIFNFSMSIVERSLWFLTLGIYYFLLGCMRGALVAHGKSSRDRRKTESVVKHIGIAFFLIAAVFSETVFLSIEENHTTGHGTIIMITMATFTFYLMTLAVINMIKARKAGDIKTIALRNISFGGAAVSMFSLEKSMIASFSEDAVDFAYKMKIFSGAVIFAILIALGINLIVITKRKP